MAHTGIDTMREESRAAVLGALLLLCALVGIGVALEVRAQRSTNARLDAVEFASRRDSSKLMDLGFSYECPTCNAVQVYDHKADPTCGGCGRPMRPAAIVQWNPLAETRTEKLGAVGRIDYELELLRGEWARVKRMGEDCQ